MAEPYKKVGRGGAGNFYSKKDVEDVNKAVAEDLEAQQASINDLTTTQTSSAPPPEYLHTGRGGAGNWVAPKELQSSGFSQEHDSNDKSTSTTIAASSIFGGVGGEGRTIGGSKPTYRGGRGGAGNYLDLEAEERERKEAEEKRRRELEERAQRDVEMGLARPEKTYGGQGGVWEMGDMK